MALVTSPSPSTPGSLRRDVALAKATVLYSDHVEMVGLAVSLLERLRQITSKDHGMLRWYLDLDDDALAHAVGRVKLDAMPRGWRENFSRALDYERYRFSNPSRWQQYRSVLEGAEDIEAGAEPLVRRLLDQSGASELALAVDAGVIRVADLGMTMSHLYRPSAKMHTDTSESIHRWIDQLALRMSDRRYRMVFDADSSEAVAELAAMGKVPSDERGSRLAVQGALGAGLIARLPAFPQARMDELLDLRADLRLSVGNYQSAIIRYAREVPTDGSYSDLEFEVQQLYESVVRPSTAQIESDLADHSLVREMAKHFDEKDVLAFIGSGGSIATCLGVASSVSSLAVAAVGAIGGVAPVVAKTAVAALRDRRSAVDENRNHEFFLLYEAGQVTRRDL